MKREHDDIYEAKISEVLVIKMSDIFSFDWVLFSIEMSATLMRSNLLDR